MKRSAPLVVAAIVCLASPGNALATADAEPSALLETIDAAVLQPDAAVSLDDVRITLDVGSLAIESGTLIPASPVGSRAVEMVFLGKAVLEIEAPSAIEGQQLELFTGSDSLEETISEAVLVICSDEASDLLLGRQAATDIPPERIERAGVLYDEWRNSTTRKLLDVRSALLFDAVGDPSYATFFVGQFESEDLGRFHVVVEPGAEEQVTVGQWVPAADTEEEAEEIRRDLHQKQRKGRLIGVTLDDLGDWDTWMSHSLRDESGEEWAGTLGFEPEHYTIDVTIDDKTRTVAGREQIVLNATTGFSRVVRLKRARGLEIPWVRERDRGDLFVVHGWGQDYALLPDVPEAGTQIELDLRFRATVLERDKKKLFHLTHTMYWHPHAGEVDLATYDVTLRWPKKLDLVASGAPVPLGESDGSGEKNDELSVRRNQMPVRTRAFSFEIGRFMTRAITAGHVEITLSFDRQARGARKDTQDEMLETLRDSVEYYEEVFGPYPLDYLTVVTTPRAYSQGLLGFVTLSDSVTWDFGLLGILLGFQDRRSVIAHEIAHQWWGHKVGFRTYRDAWISESLASYSSMIWANNRLERSERPIVDLISGWQTMLGASTKDGRPLEAVGPIVLGTRLQSSVAPQGYEAIVYKKGAVVINMLANALGEELFVASLRRIADATRHRRITTRDFVAALEKITSYDLDWFTGQYMYGTGLPEVYYEYEFEESGEGKWVVTGTARQQSPYRYTYGVKQLDEGRWDISRSAAIQMDASSSSMVVPFQVSIHKPDVESKGGRGKARSSRKRETSANAVLSGRMPISGDEHPFRIELDYEPKEFWLDRNGVVFGKFYSETRAPKRMYFYRGLDQVAAGNHAEAESLYRSALAAQSGDGEDDDAPALSNYWRKTLDLRILVNLASLYLETGRIDEAREATKEARKASLGFRTANRMNWIKVLESRIDLHEGRPQKAFSRLKRGLKGRNRLGTASGNLTLALAARAVGKSDVCRKARKAAERRHADVSGLECD